MRHKQAPTKRPRKSQAAANDCSHQLTPLDAPDPRDAIAETIFSSGRVCVEIAAVEDSEDVEAVGQLCLPISYSSYHVTKFIKYATSHVYVAREQGQTVGFIIVERRGASFLHIMSLGVHPDHRRQGIARTLVNTVKEHVVGTALTALSLFMLSSNQSARQFYWSQGFVTVKEMPRYYASLNNADGEELHWTPAAAVHLGAELEATRQRNEQQVSDF